MQGIEKVETGQGESGDKVWKGVKTGRGEWGWKVCESLRLGYHANFRNFKAN